MRKLFLLCCLLPCLLVGQKADTMYAVNPWVSVPIVVGGGILGQERLKIIQQKLDVTAEEYALIDGDDVPGIDRIGLRQDYGQKDQAETFSDVLFFGGQVAPFTLFFWKKYRRSWVDISLMYLEAQVTQSLFYGLTPIGPTVTNRYRPAIYYEEADEFIREDGNQKNSTFSGHVSVMSTGFYFTAKMVDDHNPQFTQGQRILLYSGASVPGILGGYLRVKALKHFPTDSAIGLGVGAISGILVPQVHRWWAKRHESKVALTPYYGGDATGMGMSLIF